MEANYGADRSQKQAYIILTPLNTILYSKNGVYMGKHFFLFLLKNRLWVLVRTASPNGYPQPKFWAEIIIKTILEFLLENFHFLVEIFFTSD